jgi:hypothetical protein
MALSERDQANLRNYLLGHLSHEEQEKVEERLMIDDDLFQEFEISKGELIEEYRSGELNQNDRKWFETNYLASKEGRQSHTFAAALECLDVPVPSPQRTGWLERLRALFRGQPWVLAAVSVSLLIVVGALVLNLRPGPQTALAFTLTSTSGQRGSGNAPIQRFKVSPDVGTLRISLTLPNPAPPQANYRAQLDNGVTQKPVNVEGREGNNVIVVVPALETPRGFYALKLFVTPSGGSEQELPGDYRFIIE